MPKKLFNAYICMSSLMKEKMVPCIYIEWDFPPKANTIQQKILQNTNSHLPQTLKPFNVSMKIPTVVLLPTLQKVHAKLWFVDRFKNGVPNIIMKFSYIFI